MTHENNSSWHCRATTGRIFFFFTFSRLPSAHFKFISRRIVTVPSGAITYAVSTLQSRLAMSLARPLCRTLSNVHFILSRCARADSYWRSARLTASAAAGTAAAAPHRTAPHRTASHRRWMSLGRWKRGRRVESKRKGWRGRARRGCVGMERDENTPAFYEGAEREKVGAVIYFPSKHIRWCSWYSQKKTHIASCLLFIYLICVCVFNKFT